MIEGADADCRGDGCVRDEQVQRVYAERRQQPLRCVVRALQRDTRRKPQCRFDQPVGNQLRDDVGNADEKAPRAILGIPGHGLRQFVTEREDIVGVSQRHLACVGQLQSSGCPREKRLPQSPLQRLDLRAQGGFCQLELSRRACQRAGASDRAKEMQMVKVDRWYHQIVTE